MRSWDIREQLHHFPVLIKVGVDEIEVMDGEEFTAVIERLEQQAAEAFNKHMETILDRVEYAKLERIWLQRSNQAVREGRRTTG